MLIVRTVKTDHWAIAVNNQSEVVKKLTFTVSSVARATLWGQWSNSALISRRGPFLGKYTVWTIRFLRLLTVVISFSADGAPAPVADRGVDQTLFIRRIALRTPLGYFGKSSFGPTVAEPTFFDRLNATFFNPPQAWWLVEDENNTLSLPVVASGSDNDVEIPRHNHDGSFGSVTEDESGSDGRYTPSHDRTA
jgi:hypothetical protein